MASKIPIKYINSTGNVDFEVVVFTKNYSTDTPRTYYVAWHVLKAQTSSEFVYPVEIEIGASYHFDDQLITAGPFVAKLGSSWLITQDTSSVTATLKEKTGVPANPNNTIVVQNVPPSTWSGRMFDVGIYKDHLLLLTQPSVHVGDQVDFMLQPKLYFGVVRNMQVGDVFTSLEITSALTEFDLSEFPNGIVVTLKQEPAGGRYSFSAQQM